MENQNQQFKSTAYVRKETVTLPRQPVEFQLLVKSSLPTAPTKGGGNEVATVDLYRGQLPSSSFSYVSSSIQTYRSGTSFSRVAAHNTPFHYYWVTKSTNKQGGRGGGSTRGTTSNATLQYQNPRDAPAENGLGHACLNPGNDAWEMTFGEQTKQQRTLSRLIGRSIHGRNSGAN